MLLQQLSDTIGVSGDEGPLRKLIIPAIKPHVDEVTVDTMGNVYATKKSKQPPSNLTVMLAAHMDEVGFIVTHITAQGHLDFETVGGFDKRILPGKTVLVGPNKIPGIIGLEPIHLIPRAKRTDAPALKSLVIDIGANSKDEATAKINPGDFATFDTKFSLMNRSSSDNSDERHGVVKGKALDDRAGCAMLVEILKQSYPVNVVGVFTVQEEVGLRGATVAAYKTNPDIAITLECTGTDDLPPLKEDEEIDYPRLGDGPCLTLIDKTFIANRKLVHLFEETAKKHNLPYQYKKPNLGGTDSGKIHISRAGIPTITVAVPARYIHSPVALMDLQDFWHCIQWVDLVLHALANETF